MGKVFFFDCETTGLDPKRHDIIQLGGIIEIDNRVVDTFELRQSPRSAQSVDDEALAVNGRTLPEIMQWPVNGTIYHRLIEKFDAWVDKFDKSDIMIPAGHNVGFDMDFLFALWGQKGPAGYLAAYLKGRLDTIVTATQLYLAGDIEPRDAKGSISFKLEHCCRAALGINPGWHDAVADIKATHQLYRAMQEIQVKKALNIVKPDPEPEASEKPQDSPEPPVMSDAESKPDLPLAGLQ